MLKAHPMGNIAADAFRGKLEGSDVVVEFGQSQAPASRQRETDVVLLVRIVMPLATAKRLMVALSDALEQHDGRLLFAGTGAAARSVAAGPPPRGQMAVNAQPDQAGERAALLLRLVAELGIPYQYERSFRMSEAGLLANRYLLTVNTRDMAGDPRERAMAICRRLDMPRGPQVAAEEQFGMAKCLHFGFEGDADSIIYKLYLERAVPMAEAERAKAVPEPVLMHLAFKWDILREAHVVTRYLWYPALSRRGTEVRLSQVYRDGRPAPSFEIAKAVLHLATERVPAERLQYLEVLEDENARRSFDLNVYDARLQVKDLQPLLQRMREHFGVRPGQFQALYDQIKNKTLGHVAGGVHRNGNDFFNIYYGVGGFPEFSERFG